jgi:hypothetical protein
MRLIPRPKSSRRTGDFPQDPRRLYRSRQDGRRDQGPCLRTTPLGCSIASATCAAPSSTPSGEASLAATARLLGLRPSHSYLHLIPIHRFRRRTRARVGFSLELGLTSDEMGVDCRGHCLPPPTPVG